MLSAESRGHWGTTDAWKGTPGQSPSSLRSIRAVFQRRGTPAPIPAAQPSCIGKWGTASANALSEQWRTDLAGGIYICCCSVFPRRSFLSVWSGYLRFSATRTCGKKRSERSNWSPLHLSHDDPRPLVCSMKGSLQVTQPPQKRHPFLAASAYLSARREVAGPTAGLDHAPRLSST